LISRGRWKRFAACDQVDGGARGVMATLRVIDVVVDDPAVVRDIDTPDDRQALT
jgi:CTP:molybdopterin cytidylyltransferase MocA